MPDDFSAVVRSTHDGRRERCEIRERTRDDQRTKKRSDSSASGSFPLVLHYSVSSSSSSSAFAFVVGSCCLFSIVSAFLWPQQGDDGT